MNNLLSLINIQPAEKIKNELVELRGKNQILILQNAELLAKVDDLEGSLIEANDTIQGLREKYCDSARRAMFSTAGAEGTQRLMKDLTGGAE